MPAIIVDDSVVFAESLPAYDSVLEAAIAEKWLYGELAADAAVAALVGTRIYTGMAPHNATYPFVVFSLIDGFDHTTQGVRLMADLEYLVEGVAASRCAAGRSQRSRASPRASSSIRRQSTPPLATDQRLAGFFMMFLIVLLIDE